MHPRVIADGMISLIRLDTSSHDFFIFYGGISEAGLTISLLCVLNLRGQSIVFRLLFWSLSSTTRTMLFLLPLTHFVYECPPSNYLALVLRLDYSMNWHRSLVLSLYLFRENKQLWSHSIFKWFYVIFISTKCSIQPNFWRVRFCHKKQSHCFTLEVIEPRWGRQYSKYFDCQQFSSKDQNH